MDAYSEAIRRQIDASIAVKQAVLNDPQLIGKIGILAEQSLTALRAGGKIIFAGNGGSFADAQHLSAEFTSRFQFDRAPLASLALGTNSSAISAIGNDYGYDQVFSRELEAIAKPGDIFIPITTSGNSPNLLAAVNVARTHAIATVCLTGHTGGKIKALCDCICVPSSETPRIQECHILIGHILCGLIERHYFA
ncbi:MAG: SIS domain-containing protein [Magnetococcales bacterium]|nr:SIS domain-containing protein [Magnetococcales bacterium]